MNGDDPEACVRVARLAFEYRQQFHKDVVIDMVCYRRHGHNEGDDPSYTQPLMYKRIDERRSVRKLFMEALVKRGDITLDEAEEALADFQRRLQGRSTRRESRTRRAAELRPSRRRPLGVLPPVDTGVDRGDARPVIAALDHPPEGFAIHPKLAKQFETRAKLYEGARSTGRRPRRWPSARCSSRDPHPLRRAGLLSWHLHQRHAVLCRLRNGAEAHRRWPTSTRTRASSLMDGQLTQTNKRVYLTYILLLHFLHLYLFFSIIP